MARFQPYVTVGGVHAGANCVPPSANASLMDSAWGLSAVTKKVSVDTPKNSVPPVPPIAPRADPSLKTG
jgi:hypothetical protein